MIFVLELAEVGPHEEMFGSYLLIEAVDREDARKVFDAWAVNEYELAKAFGTDYDKKKSLHQIWDTITPLGRKSLVVDVVRNIV